MSSPTKIISEYRKMNYKKNNIDNRIIEILCEELSLYNSLLNFIGHLNKDYDIVSAHF